MNIQDWQKSIDDVDTACTKLRAELAKRLPGDMYAAILIGFLDTALNALRGATILHQSSLSGEALVLVRVAIEVRINLEYWLRMFRADPEDAVKRYAAAMILDKIKQQRMSSFVGSETVQNGLTEAKAKEIDALLEAQYGVEGVRKLRTLGFSGISAENRAKALGLEKLYDIAYRIFSTYAHGTNFAAQLVSSGGVQADGFEELRHLRDCVGLSASIESVVTIALNVDHVGMLGLQADLKRALTNARLLPDWVPTP